METCAFDPLFTRSVPHILEKIFFYLDYDSFQQCVRVNTTWYELLTSDSYRKKAKTLFCEEIFNDQRRLLKASLDSLLYLLRWWKNRTDNATKQIINWHKYACMSFVNMASLWLSFTQRLSLVEMCLGRASGNWLPAC